MAKESDFEWQARKMAMTVDEKWSRKTTAMKIEAPHGLIYVFCMYMFVAYA